jgi:hypothetical protein
MKKPRVENIPFLPGIGPESEPPAVVKSENPTQNTPKSSGREMEVIHCQYCQDVGPCMFCKRGRIETAALKARRGRKF